MATGLPLLEVRPSPPPRKRRLFFALWPDEATRAKLAAFLAKLPAGAGRDMRAANLHLTLAFLGDCEEGLLPCLESVGDALDGAGFTLTLDQLGHFREARVLWLGCSHPPEALLALQARLTEQLTQRCGLAPPPQRFLPHLSLRRAVYHPCPWPEGAVPLRWSVDSFTLVESIPGPDGVTYLPIHLWPLRT